VIVLLAGGGTAGHIEPALATAAALARRDPDVQVRMLGTRRGLETTLVPARGLPLDLIEPVPLPRRPSGDLLRLPGRLRSAVRDVRRLISEHRIDVVAGFGGYVALPAYLAARGRVPIVVHEANARPGLANRVGARFATAVAAATAPVLPGATVIGMPLSRSIADCDRAAGRAAARAGWGLADDRPVLLVTGGSQGARRLNQALIGALPDLLATGVQVLHVTGRQNEPDVRTAVAEVGVTEGAGYVLVPYVDDMATAYAAADLTVCRAGMMTVAETTTVGLPAIYVPLPIGNGEQRLNATPVAAAGGAVIVDDVELDGARLLAEVLPLIRNPATLDRMGAAAASLGRRDADDRLAGMIFDAVRTRS
jgi:UDP-N-acetylglucosamine--N-acetylmuramyl-(pentapeptide) pyrophosphoryl-undecaprenol N-acetylglucosamine transferase